MQGLLRLYNRIPRRIKKALDQPFKKQLKSYLKRRLFRKAMKNLKVDVVLAGRNSPRRAFGIVHWNAVDFLFLNIKQIEKLHPESKIYVFDNASGERNLNLVIDELKKHDRITLFSQRTDYSDTWINHTIALQYLLNYSAHQRDEVIAFLDQDCILNNTIDPLIGKLSPDCLLVGANDYVMISKDFGILKNRRIRNYPGLVHASFMILPPVKIVEMFGNESLFDSRAFEPYHGISKKLTNRILFLEMKAHEDIPLLTGYVYGRQIYAWHSWYSSRAATLDVDDTLDGIPVKALREMLRRAFEFMAHVVG